MRLWEELSWQHDGVRRLPMSWTSQFRQQLQHLAAAGYCHRSVGSRFSDRRNLHVTEWSIRPLEKSLPSLGEPLVGIKGIREAWLNVFALVRSDHTILCLDVRATGKRDDGTEFVVAVHLSDERMTEGRHGFGACGHAVLHCHVGPDLETVPKVRVPLPALGPVEILQWVLSQVVPTKKFEPAPWEDVKKAPTQGAV